MIRRVPDAYSAFKPWYDDDVSLMKGERTFGDLTTDANAVFLCLLAKRAKGPIVEFGTYHGRTAMEMAMNTTQAVYTIDIGKNTGEGYKDYVVGERFVNVSEQEMPNKPKQILGDSRTVVVPVPPKSAGLVYIDGGHDYDIVRSDSARAFELVRADGVIVWDDYSGAWRGVVDYINQLGEQMDLLWVGQQGFIVWNLWPLSCSCDPPLAPGMTIIG